MDSFWAALQQTCPAERDRTDEVLAFNFKSSIAHGSANGHAGCGHFALAICAFEGKGRGGDSRKVLMSDVHPLK